MKFVHPQLLVTLLAAIAVTAPVAAAQNGCVGCVGDPFASDAPDDAIRSLKVVVTAGMEFAPIAVGSNGGSATLDVVDESTRLAGDVVPLGGYSFRGEVRLEGEPNKPVAVIMPDSIELQSVDGDIITVRDIVTTLGPMPRLGVDGRLDFQFGGRLAVSGNIDGTFRGRIPITANYQ